MNAEIIGVGTELLLGHTINSDAAYVARELARFGINVRRMVAVGDNRERLAEALRDALARCDLVVTTGGLGPTDDDLTKEVAAAVCGVPLREDARSVAMLKEYFGDRPMGANQSRQTLAPEGATIFPNPNGTAPGYAITRADGRIVILLPGPPRELIPMLESSVRAFLAAKSKRVIESRILRVFGMGEGRAAETLGELTDGANPSVATYAGDGEILVKITAAGADAGEVRKLIEPARDETIKRLGDVFYGEDVDSLEQVVVAALAERGLAVATAESCTGGLLAKRITDVPGASAVFNLGVVTYSNAEKTKILGVAPDILNTVGAVSRETAIAMAEGIRALAVADFGLATTGIAGPDGGTPEKPVGLVYIALAFAGGVRVRITRPQGRYLGREWTRRRASSHALDLLRRKLFDLPTEIAER